MTTFSPLVGRTVPTRKFSSRDGATPNQLIVHHTAGGTDEGNEAHLSSSDVRVSATYLLRTDGTLTGIVPEEYQPWTTGGDWPDNYAVTVEVVNTGGGPDWPVSDAQIATLVALAADLSSRYGWGPLTRDNVKGHREYMATACPGPYLFDRLQYICDAANGNSAVAPPPVDIPTPSVPTWDIGVKPAWPAGFGPNDYLGDIEGPAQSHGGDARFDGPDVNACIAWVQRWLIVNGFVPGVSNPYGGWADGIYESPTVEAVTRAQQSNADWWAITSRPGEVWQHDDYARMN